MSVRKPATLIIDEINLRLPAGMQPRATTIAHEVSRQLAREPMHAPASADSLSASPVKAGRSESDVVIAGRVVREIRRAISRGNGATNGGPHVR